MSSSAQIAGNASDAVKERVINAGNLISKAHVHFAKEISNELILTEVDIRPKADEPHRMEARVVLEITVVESMLNSLGSVHGGCTAYLIDIASTLPFAAINESGEMGVSQAINIVYHAPAKLGDKLRLVNTSITVGSRIMTSRCEVWDIPHHRLVASGTHIKMAASQPKL